ncbi:MAG: PHB depolymerase family esterase [Vicinamibacterales bacterium]
MPLRSLHPSLLRVLPLVLAWMTWSANTAEAADLMTWTVDGQPRQATVYVPAAASEPAPLVLAFHGFGDEMENFQYVGLHRAWPEAVVVYLQGLPTRERYRGWQTERGQYGDRDLKLVDTALASLRTKYRIDESRIYATGFSNGAMFTYLLWAERPAVFAAYAPIAGRVRASVQPAVKRPVLHVAGTRDATVRYTDQQAAFEMAMRVNGVEAVAKACGTGCTIYGEATPAPVMVLTHDGGHTIPSGTPQRVVAFLREFRLRP